MDIKDIPTTGQGGMHDYPKPTLEHKRHGEIRLAITDGGHVYVEAPTWLPARSQNAVRATLHVYRQPSGEWDAIGRNESTKHYSDDSKRLESSYITAVGSFKDVDYSRKLKIVAEVLALVVPFLESDEAAPLLRDAESKKLARLWHDADNTVAEAQQALKTAQKARAQVGRAIAAFEKLQEVRHAH